MSTALSHDRLVCVWDQGRENWQFFFRYCFQCLTGAHECPDEYNDCIECFISASLNTWQIFYYFNKLTFSSFEHFENEHKKVEDTVSVATHCSSDRVFWDKLHFFIDLLITLGEHVYALRMHKRRLLITIMAATVIDKSHLAVHRHMHSHAIELVLEIFFSIHPSPEMEMCTTKCSEKCKNVCATQLLNHQALTQLRSLLHATKCRMWFSGRTDCAVLAQELATLPMQRLAYWQERTLDSISCSCRFLRITHRIIGSPFDWHE